MTYRKVGGIHFLSSRFFTLSFSMRSNRPCLIKYLGASLGLRLASLVAALPPEGIAVASVAVASLSVPYMTIAETGLPLDVTFAPPPSILNYLVLGFL